MKQQTSFIQNTAPIAIFFQFLYIQRMRKSSKPAARRIPDSLYIQGKAPQAVNPMAASFNSSQKQQRLQQIQKGFNSRGAKESKMSNGTSDKAVPPDLFKFYNVMDDVVDYDDEPGPEEFKGFLGSQVAQSQLRQPSDHDELDSRNSNVLKKDLGTAWYGVQSPGNYQDKVSTLNSKKFSPSPQRKRSAISRSKGIASPTFSKMRTPGQIDGFNQSSNDTSYRSERRNIQNKLQKKKNNMLFQSPSQARDPIVETGTDRIVVLDNHSQDNSQVSGRFATANNTTITNVPNMLMKSSSDIPTPKTPIPIAQGKHKQSHRSIKQQLQPPNDYNKESQQYDLIFINTESMVPVIKINSIPRIYSQKGNTIQMPSVQINPQLRHQFNQNLDYLRHNVQEEFKTSVERMVEFLHQSSIKDKDELNQLVNNIDQSEALQWDLIAQNLGLLGFQELVLIYNLYNQPEFASSFNPSRTTSRHGRRSLTSNLRYRGKSATTQSKYPLYKLSKQQSTHYQSQKHLGKFKMSKDKSATSKKVPTLKDKIEELKRNTNADALEAKLQSDLKDPIKKQLVPDYICLHQDTDAFPMRTLSSAKAYDQFRAKQSRSAQSKLVAVGGGSLTESMRLMQTSLKKREFAIFQKGLEKQGLTISRKQILRPQKVELVNIRDQKIQGDVEESKQQERNSDLSQSLNKSQFKKKSTIVDNIDTKRKSGAESLFDPQKTEKSFKSKLYKSIDNKKDGVTNSVLGAPSLMGTSQVGGTQPLKIKDIIQQKKEEDALRKEHINALLTWDPSDFNFMRRNNIPDHNSNQLCSSSQFSHSRAPPVTTIQSQKPFSAGIRANEDNREPTEETSIADKSIIYQRHRIISSTRNKQKLNEDISHVPSQATADMKKFVQDLVDLDAQMKHPYENIENLMACTLENNANNNNKSVSDATNNMNDVQTGWEHSNTLKLYTNNEASNHNDDSPLLNKQNSNEITNYTQEHPTFKFNTPEEVFCTDDTNKQTKAIDETLETLDELQSKHHKKMTSRQIVTLQDSNQRPSSHEATRSNHQQNQIKFELKKFRDFVELSKHQDLDLLDKMDSMIEQKNKMHNQLGQQKKTSQDANGNQDSSQSLVNLSEQQVIAGQKEPGQNQTLLRQRQMLRDARDSRSSKSQEMLASIIQGNNNFYMLRNNKQLSDSKGRPPLKPGKSNTNKLTILHKKKSCGRLNRREKVLLIQRQQSSTQEHVNTETISRMGTNPTNIGSRKYSADVASTNVSATNKQSKLQTNFYNTESSILKNMQSRYATTAAPGTEEQQSLSQSVKQLPLKKQATAARPKIHPLEQRLKKDEYMIRTPDGWNEEKENQFSETQQNNRILLNEVHEKISSQFRTQSHSNRPQAGVLNQSRIFQQSRAANNQTAKTQTLDSKSRAVGTGIGGDPTDNMSSSFGNQQGNPLGNPLGNLERPRTCVGIHQQYHRSFLNGTGQLIGLKDNDLINAGASNKSRNAGNSASQHNRGGGGNFNTTNFSQKYTHSQTVLESRNDQISNLLEKTFWKVNNFSVSNKAIHNKHWRPEIAQYINDDIQIQPTHVKKVKLRESTDTQQTKTAKAGSVHEEKSTNSMESIQKKQRDVFWKKDEPRVKPIIIKNWKTFRTMQRKRVELKK